MRLWLAVVGVAALAGIGGGVALRSAFAGAHAAPALPEFHGSASWPAGKRPAPAFALRDQAGRLVSLRSLRGRDVVVTFLDSHCKEQCPLAGRALGSIVRRLPARARPTVLIVSVNPADTPRSVRAAARRWLLAGDWHWLLGSKRSLAPVWRSYGIEVIPSTGDIAHTVALYLIDRRGDERTGYLFPFAQPFVERDLRTLAGSAA